MKARIPVLIAALGLVVMFASICPAAPGKTYVFGVNPWDKPEVMRKMFRPLMDYLRETTGVTFRISISPTYDQLMKDMGSGYVQLASLNAVSYLKAMKKYKGMRYLVTAVQTVGGESHDYYEGFIIVRKDSPYHTLEDLNGKTFAFVDVDSNSGYKMPVALMAQKGLDPDSFFKKYFFVGDHDEVAKAVKNHSVDGGATWDNSYKMNSKKYGNIYRVILRTPNIPNEAWVAGVGVPPDVSQKIKAALLSINETTRTKDGRLVIDLNQGFPNTSWSERGDALYQAAAPLLLYNDKSQ